MLRIAWRLSKGYRLRPWRSPYLRWRIETYLGVHADSITTGDFFKIAWRERTGFHRYLQWADRMDRR
jgi:hypothetical protein